MAEGAWNTTFEAMKRGEGCPMCEDRTEDSLHGRRFMVGRVSDGYLGRHPVRRGYAYVIWRGRHVVEPTELSPDEARDFWSEVARVAHAIEVRYQPMKMNWLSLGNGVPHLHVHLVPRYSDDPAAGGPLEREAFDFDSIAPLREEAIEAEVAALAELAKADR